MVKRKQAKKTVPELIKDLDSMGTYARKNAIVQLASKKAEEASPRLQEFCSGPDATLRAVSAWALGEIGQTSSASTLEPMLKDMDTEVRRSAVKALGLLANPGSVYSLQQATMDSDRWVGELAGKALATIHEARDHSGPAENAGDEADILELKS